MALPVPNAKLTLFVLGSTAFFLALTAWGWGSWTGLVAHRARLSACVLAILSSIAVLFTGVTLEDSTRGDGASRWIVLFFLVFSAVLAWLQPYADRHDLATLDGDTIRYVGLGMLTLGIVLRVGPIFALGRRFRVPWAPQQEHRLVTTGFYRYIRNPSYLGAFLLAMGWALVFRGALFALVYLLLLPVLGARILRREEAMLLAEFGEEYTAYQQRTWRFLPFVY